MARPELTVEAVERSTYVVTLSFTDEDANPVVPDELKWTLTTVSGDVVNGLMDQNATPAATVTIILKGADLQILGLKDDGKRLLTVEGTYTSDAGPGLPINEEYEFTVRPLVAVG